LSSFPTSLSLSQHIHELLSKADFSLAYSPEGKDKALNFRLKTGLDSLISGYQKLYQHHPKGDETFEKLIKMLIKYGQNRAAEFKSRDESKPSNWFLSNELVGMSLYVDRFCGDLRAMPGRLPYLQELGVNFLHLMPLFESPAGESDGGYAVSNFQKVDPKFGTLADLKKLRKAMQGQDMNLMLDIVLNHTSHRHEWAEKAKAGDPYYQDFFYMYDNRWIPNEFDQSMPEIFPESSPGNFTYVPECDKWVMTVFHSYQWDLNFMNPEVFVAMLENVLFYANLGVDLLRIDAPAFIWKQNGTSSQNLPQAHQLLQLIKQCVQISAPGMALLGEAIVAPKEIIKYFGTGEFTAKECDFAYNATQMALQWDMLATGDTRVMLAAQHDILQKPMGTSWITYTRCHDDIGLGYEDAKIAQVGKDPYQHRQFLKEYYSGNYPGSPAKGALFSSNPKTGDARISGSLASLCGLEKAIEIKDEQMIALSIQKILLMQAHSFFLGGMPMVYYGDELGYTNDYSYQDDPGKSYDNRWMHRPMIDWEKSAQIKREGSIEARLFSATQKLIRIRKQLSVVSDLKNLTWLAPHNIHVAGFVRSYGNQKLYCLFNFANEAAYLTWYAFKEHGKIPNELLDHWTGEKFQVGPDNEYLIIPAYGFYILEVI
jgi:amylosucrase